MTQIKLRRDTSANFTSKNPVLGVGEPAYETDTKKLKIGDGTTAYTQLEYFSAGGGGSTNISATLPLKIVDGVISLEVDGQTIQIVDGRLHANLDDKQDKFETQIPLSISSSSITTSVPANITETTESWSGGGHDNLITVDVSALNVDANSDWKIHLSGYMGNYHATNTNTNVLIISAEKNVIFRVWFGSADFRLGNDVITFKRIPDSNREFFYEIVHQRNGTEFTFNGTDLVDSNPLSISKMSGAIGQGTYTTLAGQGKLKNLSFVINSDQFQRIDRDITKSYFEADGVKYRFTSVEGTNTLNLNIGSGLSVVDGKLTASSTAPTNMVTTDTSQTITGSKTFKGPIKVTNSEYTRTLADVNTNGGVPYLYLGESTSRMYLRASNPINRMSDGGVEYPIIDTGNLGSYVDGTTITYTNNKLSTTGGGSAPTNMVTTDTAQTISGGKTFTGSNTFQSPITISNTGTGQIDKLRLAALNGSSTATTLYNGLQIFTDLDTYTSTLKVGDVGLPMIIQGSTIKDGSGNKFLTSGNVTAYVTEEFVDGTEGYRIWSNGRCEQWGQKTSIGDIQTITFLKTYANTNFTLLANMIDSPSTAYKIQGKGATTSSASFVVSDNTYYMAGVLYCWYVSGVLAS